MSRRRQLRLAASALAVRVTRSLHGRWRGLPQAERERLEPLAEEARRRALDLRGEGDREAAGRELQAASESLAAALVESAEADPAIDEVELRRLRDDLRRELDRLASAEITALRGDGGGEPPPPGASGSSAAL